MSPSPKKYQQPANLLEAINQNAWRPITEFGASALSLRAIARGLGITAPSIYNYFTDRDAYQQVVAF
jgi:AcrR family transcriptional regulator